MSTYISNFARILQPIVFIGWVCIKVLLPMFFVNIYQFKVNSRNTRIVCKILTPKERYIVIKIPEMPDRLLLLKRMF